MQKEEKKISKELVTLAPKVNCKAFLVFLLKHLSLSVLYLCWKSSCYDKKKNWCTTWESWLRCQMSTGLENDVINTRSIGHAVCIAVAWVLWCFVVYLQQIGKLLSTWTDNQPTEVPTWRSDATCKRTSEGFIILLLLLQEIAWHKNMLSTERKLLIIPTQSSAAKILELRSLDPDFASPSRICRSLLQAAINWATLTWTIWLILVFKYLSPIVESKR